MSYPSSSSSSQQQSEIGLEFYKENQSKLKSLSIDKKELFHLVHVMCMNTQNTKMWKKKRTLV